MDRSTIIRWIVIALLVWLGWTYLPKFCGGGESSSNAIQPIRPESACDVQLPCVPAERAPEVICQISGNRFAAQFSSRGASLTSLKLTGDDRYRQKEGDGSFAGEPIDLVTSSSIEQRRPLRFDWRSAGVSRGEDAQVQYDAFDWVLSEQSDSHCVFVYSDENVEIQKTVKAGVRPFEISIEAVVKNLSEKKRKHALSVEVVTWRYQSEVESHLGRQSPHMTHLSCAYDKEYVKKNLSDFEPSDFGKKEFEGGDWSVSRGNVSHAAVSDFYFAQALIPDTPEAIGCLMQIEERWDPIRFADKAKDPNYGAIYRTRLSYAPKDLSQGQSEKYQITAFIGPKERDVLSGAAGGNHRLSELVDLGFFSFIAKGLLVFLVWLHSLVKNWGIAIILMTVGVRALLFPLTLWQIRSGFAMRRLRPEIDAINKKYANDQQGKGIATMELWKKHKVNPAIGCLPALFQLPVWWALFTSLQTAVELYHTPFLWFPDLSSPDPYYVAPVILGLTMIIQQKLMPMQMDPVQQKMMTYIMPGVFTVMMLFLPSGLAVYMLTNAVIGISQQLIIERYYASQGLASPAVSSAKSANSGITVREKPDKTQPNKDK